MARSQKAEVVITCNASQAKQMIEMLRAQAEQLRQTYAKRVAEYKKLLAQSGKETDQTRALRKEINALERQFKTLDSAEKHNLQELGDINKILKNLSGATTRQLRSALSTLKKELENTSGSEIQRQKQLQMQMKAVQKQIDKNTGAVSKHGNAWKTSIRNIGTYLGMFTLVSTAISKLGDVFRKNLDMSDQLSQIRMVSGLSMRMVDKLSERVRQVDTRSTLTDLQQIAYEGSKLGFGKYGVEGLAGFTEAANQVNVALKEQMGEDTLPMMSKMVENMGLIKKMGIEKALLSTGSAMFRLSASSTSSANNIMEFAKRLAGLASVSKITTPQLLALGSASDSMMLMPEVASTAFNKIITHLQTQPQTIAKALKIPKDTLKDMLSAGKTMDALLLVFQRMHDMGNMNALGGIFKPLGSDGARLNAVAVSMAKNVDMLREHVKTATDAFIDGQDVTKEYNLRQETANGLMERANNLWSKAFVNKDGVDSVKELALQWYNLSKEMTSSQGVMNSLRLTFELLIWDAKQIIRWLPQIIMFFSTYGIIRGIQAAVVAITELRAAMLAAKTAQEGLNIAMKSNVFGAIAALVVTVVGTIYAYASATKEAAEKQNSLNDAVHEYKVQAKAAEIEVYRHYQAILKAKKGTQERTAAIKEFNKIYGGYIDNLLTETSSAKDLANAYHAVVKQLQNKYALEARDKEMKRVVQPRLQWSANRLENYDESINGTTHSAQSSSWLYGFYQDHSNLGPWGFANLLRRHAGYNVSDAQFAAAIRQRSDKFYHDPDGNFKLEGITKGYKWHPAKNAAEANAFWNAMAYYAQQKSTDKWTGKVNKAFGPFISNEDLSADDTSAGTFNKDKTEDKLAAKAAAKAERERLKKERAARAKARKAANEELKIAENNATAIISNIEAYYNLQEAALNDMVKDGRRTTAEVTSLVADLKIRRNKALANARFALSGQKNDFEKIRQEMGRGWDMFTHPDKDGNDRSSDLLKSIQGIDVNQAYKTLAKFDGSDKVYGISAKSFLDEINKNGTKNLEENSEIEKKRAEAIDSVMRSYNEISNLYKTTADNFVTLGLEVQNFADAAQVEYPHSGPNTPVDANGKPITQVGKEGFITEGKLAGDHALNGVTVTAPKGVRQHPFDAMLASFVGDGYRPYVGDISTDKGMYEWLSGFLSNYTQDEDGNPQIAAWAKQLNLTRDFANQIDDAAIRDATGNIDPEKLKKQLDPIRKNVQLFYYELMKFGDAYYEKLKSDADKQKKIIGEMWTRSNEYRQYSNADRALSRMSDRESIYGRRQNDWQPFGFSKTVRGDDVEMAEKRNNLRAAQVQYQLAKLKTTDPKVLNEYLDKIDKAQNELEKTVASRVTDRMSALKQWTDPIEQWGTAMGKAFAQMTDSAKAGRDAVKEALADMVRAYAQSTVKIINELMMRKVKEELIRKAAKKGKKSGFETELFNDNGIPTGTIENANLIIANSNLTSPAPTGTPTAVSGTAGNAVNSTTTAMTPEEGVKAGAAGAEEGRKAAERVSQELGEGNTDATSVVGGALGSAAGDALGGLSSKVQQKVAENKAIEKENKKHNEKIEKQNKDSDKKVKKQENDSGKARAQMKREHNKQILGAETALAAGQQTVTGTITAIQNKAQQESDAANTNSTVKNATTDTEGGIVSGAAKIIGKLGWWGIPLVAVITALLNGLLSAFLSKLGKSNSSTSSGTNTKLKTGMLTYDEGNVQQYRGLLDGQSYPVVGNDGRVYAATSVSQAVTGIVRSPIATMINGQPSLVAERGPEMVIGRETTAAMMMNRPDLLREIIMYDKNRSSMPYRTYDAGNVQQVTAGTPSVDNETKAVMGALSVAITSLVNRLNEPFEARMDPYGRGGALDALNKAQQFMNKHK